MARIRVVLVGPKAEGNVGAAARAMANFGIEDLVLVDPPRLADDAKSRAMHAWPIIERARIARDFADAIQGSDFVVGTTARIPPNEKAHVRNPIEARELARKIQPMEGTVALCFGREDFGLFNEELEQCDLTVTIPTASAYKSLNLSHAVAVVLYEVYVAQQTGPVKPLTPMSEEMKTTFNRYFDQLIDQLGMPEHKARGTKQAYRKLLGRAVPSSWEYYILMGVISALLRKYGVEIESGRWDADFDPSEALARDYRAFLDAGDPPSPRGPLDAV